MQCINLLLSRIVSLTHTLSLSLQRTQDLSNAGLFPPSSGPVEASVPQMSYSAPSSDSWGPKAGG